MDFLFFQHWIRCVGLQDGLHVTVGVFDPLIHRTGRILGMEIGNGYYVHAVGMDGIQIGIVHENFPVWICFDTG